MASEYVSELAALHALTALDEEEKFWADELHTHSPDFQAQTAELESTVAMLAYGVAPIPLAANLKERLFQQIAAEDIFGQGGKVQLERTAENSASDPAELSILLNQTKTVDWQPYSPTPGVQIATLRIDVTNRQVDCFVRSLGQTKFPQHRHADREEIVVLAGDLIIGDRAYTQGDRVYSLPGTVHQPETRTGCILFLRTSLDDEILG
ncbi:MAG: cupin domain-containing protein [Scytolyngbya sp. HA4215-MV1]|nr:cupin domain-containing protein [Scytolyngbya sp. HA4215-MV1]